jgi:hypothetical protein
MHSHALSMGRQGKFNTYEQHAYGNAFQSATTYAGSGVLENALYGRWVCAYPGQPRRSVSWTRRGHQAAAYLVLATLWEYYEDDTGDAPKYSVKELLDASERHVV